MITAGKVKEWKFMRGVSCPHFANGQASHVHLIFRGKENNPGDLLRDLKAFTSKKLQALVSENHQESRKEWMLWLMEKAGFKNSNVKKRPRKCGMEKN